jgi:exonuclease VII small subunit
MKVTENNIISLPERVVRLETIIENIDRRFDRLEESLNKTFANIDKRFEQIDKRFEQLEYKFDSKFFNNSLHIVVLPEQSFPIIQTILFIFFIKKCLFNLSFILYKLSSIKIFPSK